MADQQLTAPCGKSLSLIYEIISELSIAPRETTNLECQELSKALNHTTKRYSSHVLVAIVIYWNEMLNAPYCVVLSLERTHGIMQKDVS